MQTEKVDLENTVVDESQRQLNNQSTSSSTLLQDKFSGKFCNKKNNNIKNWFCKPLWFIYHYADAWLVFRSSYSPV